MGSRTLWVLVLEPLGTGVSPELTPAFPGFSALGSSLQDTLRVLLSPALAVLA